MKIKLQFGVKFDTQIIE